MSSLFYYHITEAFSSLSNLFSTSYHETPVLFCFRDMQDRFQPLVQVRLQNAPRSDQKTDIYM